MKELETLNIVIQAQTQTFKKEIGKVNQSLNGMNKVVGGLQKKLLAGFSVAGLVLLTKSILKNADALQTLSDRTGIGVERLQELQYLANQTGADVNSLGMAIKSFNEQIASGNQVFAQLGINTSNTEQAFNDTLIALSKMTNEAERAQVGSQLLGRGFVALLPIIAQGEDGINALVNEARTIGGVMSKETVGAIKRLSDSLVLLKTAIVGAFRPIVEFVVPILQRMVNWLIIATGFINGIIQALFGLSAASNAVAGNTIKSNNAIIKSNGKLAKSYAGFDELNTISQDTGGTSTEVSGFDGFGEFDGDSLSASLELAKTRMKEFNNAVEAGKKFWEDYGGAVTTATAAVTLFWGAWAYGPAIAGFISGVFGTMREVIETAFLTLWVWLDDVSLSLYEMATRGAGAAGIIDDLAYAFLNLSGFTISSFSAIALAVGVIAGVIAILVAMGIAIVDLWKNNEEFRNNIMNIWDGIGRIFKTVWDTVIAPILWAFGEIWKLIYDGFILPFYEQVKVFVLRLSELFTEIWNIIEPIVDLIVKVFGPLIVGVFMFVGVAIGTLISIFFVLLNIVITVFDGVARVLLWVVKFVKDNFLDPLMLYFNGIIDFFTGIFTGDINKAVQGLADVFSGIIAIVTTPFGRAFNWVVDLWNNTIGKLSWKVPDWVPLIGGNTISAPKLTKFNVSIPKLAQGGIVDEGQLFIAGEAGSELIGSHKGKQTVMPLENTDFVNAMRDAVLEGVVAGLGAQQGNGGDIVLTVDGMVLAKATEKNLNKLSTLKGGLDIAF